MIGHMDGARRRLLALPLMIVVAASLAVPGSASAGGNAAAGQKKAASCVACHGEDGKGVSPEFPILAGQYASYLEQALSQYKSGKRKNAIMAGFAAGLSEEDIQDLAAFYATRDSALYVPKP